MEWKSKGSLIKCVPKVKIASVFVSHIISSRCSCAKVILCQESVPSNVVRQTAVHVFLQ
jgi:hypothetical protein